MEFLLYLVRHGETDHNKECIIQGQLDVPLSAVGVEQARQLRHRLSKITWKQVYASDLKRSWETADILIPSEVDYSSHLMRESLIFKDERLRERHFGVAQGQNTTFLVQSAKKAGVAVSNYLPRDAETQIDVRIRAMSFFKDLCRTIITYKEEKKANVLLVGHGGWLREFLIYLTSLKEYAPSENDRKEAFRRLSPNTGVSCFEINLNEHGDVRIIKCLYLNDASHLKASNVKDELAV